MRHPPRWLWAACSRENLIAFFTSETQRTRIHRAVGTAVGILDVDVGLGKLLGQVRQGSRLIGEFDRQHVGFHNQRSWSPSTCRAVCGSLATDSTASRDRTKTEIQRMLTSVTSPSTLQTAVNRPGLFSRSQLLLDHRTTSPRSIGKGSQHGDASLSDSLILECPRLDFQRAAAGTATAQAVCQDGLREISTLHRKSPTIVLHQTVFRRLRVNFES